MRDQSTSLTTDLTEPLEHRGQCSGRQTGLIQQVQRKNIGVAFSIARIARLDQPFRHEQYGCATREITEQQAQNADRPGGAQRNTGRVAGDRALLEAGAAALHVHANLLSKYVSVDVSM